MRAVVRSLVALALVGIVFLPHASSAQTLENTLIINKVVEGDVPPGTEFQIGFGCGQNEGQSEDGGAFTFGAEGGTESVSFPAELRFCNITEDDPGATGATTRYSGTSATATITPSATTVDVEFEANSSVPQQAEITVTNTFAEDEPVEPPAAAPAEVVPSFTG